MSLITDFLEGNMPDNNGYYLYEYWAFEDLELEKRHDFIQWMFPLDTISSVNLEAPSLTKSDIDIVKSSKKIKNNMINSLNIMLNFYGLELVSKDIIIVQKSKDFEIKHKNWIKPFNHNFLRITRILRSLFLVGLEEYAEAVFVAMQEIYTEYPFVISKNTYQYWKGYKDGK